MSAQALPSLRAGLLGVFAKVPEPGRVKTRLVPALGERGAVELAWAFLHDTLETVKGCRRGETVLLISPDAAPLRLFATAGAAAPHVLDQGSGDLGVRLERFFTHALARHPWAIALGTDSPGMPASKLDEAIDALETSSAQAVFGPALDGGYYLLGVKAIAPRMLGDVRWSTSAALIDSERALARAGLSSCRISAWFDVDEPHDLVRLTELLQRREVTAPQTALVLETLKRRETLA